MKIYKDGNLWFEATSPNELLSMCQTIANSLRNNYFTNVETMNLIASARSVYQVETMPSEPTINTVYYVGTQAPYDVKLVDSNGTVVNLGDGDADFSNFYTKTECDNRYLYKQDFLNTMYPKGSIYITYENKNPSTFLGGTWVLIGGQDANLNYYPAFAISTDTAGTTISESLPNITGSFGMDTGGQGQPEIGTATGPFQQGLLTNKPYPEPFGTSTNPRGWTFDLSRVSNIYQNNAHVNVNAIKLFFWRRTDDAPIVYNTGNITMDTEITSSATNDHIPTSKAVYDISKPIEITKTYNSTYIRESYGKFIAIGKMLIANIGVYVKTEIPANTIFCNITGDITVANGEHYGFFTSDQDSFGEQKTRVILSSSSKQIRAKGISIPVGWWFGQITIILQ